MRDQKKIYLKKLIKEKFKYMCKNYMAIFLLTIIGAILTFFAMNTEKELQTALIAGVASIITIMFSIQFNIESRKKTNNNLIHELIKQNFTLVNQKNDEINKMVDSINHMFIKDRIATLFIYKLQNISKDKLPPENVFLTEDSSLNKRVQEYYKNPNSSHARVILYIYIYLFDNQNYKKLPKGALKKQVERLDKNKNNLCPKGKNFSYMQKLYIESYDSSSYEDIFSIINAEITENYKELEYFFRHTHRIVKMINEIPSKKTRKMFLGILRAQYSSNIMIAIYINSVYTEHGLGLAEQLLCSDFFGDSKDLFENIFDIHMDLESIFLTSENKNIIKQNFFLKENSKRALKHSEVKKYLRNSFKKK